MKNKILTVLAFSLFVSPFASAAVCKFFFISTVVDEKGVTKNVETEGVTLNINDTIGNRRSMFREYMYTVQESAGTITIVFQGKDVPYPVVAAVSGAANSEIPVSIFVPSEGQLVGMRCKP